MLTRSSIALSLLAAVACIAATPAGAATPLLREAPDLMLGRWQTAQLPGGNFQRPTGTTVFGGYGNSALAYAMLLEAERTQNDAYFKTSMKSFSWLVGNRIAAQGVFFRLFVAAGYNFANTHYGSRPEFTSIKRKWALRLRRFHWDAGPIGNAYRYNKNVVEAVEAIELVHSRLRSNLRGAILRDRNDALNRATRVLGVLVPQKSAAYSKLAGPSEGWPAVVRVTDFSDPPDNPPAYDALVAAMYARGVSLLPKSRRTAVMRDTSRALLRGVITRTAPDGDIAFAGRSQEEAWALTSNIYAAWNAMGSAGTVDRSVMLTFGRREIDRLLSEHTKSSDPNGFLLTPAEACCATADIPPGQDSYFDRAAYTGLTAAMLEWAFATQPADWDSPTGRIPTDNFSLYNFPVGRGRFLQHRGASIYWMLRGQGDNQDARADSGVAVFKSRRTDGSWADVIPPRPFSGGHHRPADPASPCLAFGKDDAKCAYMELRDPQTGVGTVHFFAQWRDTRGKVRFTGTATAIPTNTGLRLTWSTQPGQLYKIDHFLPNARCTALGAAGPGVTIAVTELTDCRIVAKGYAGGAQVELDRVRVVAVPQGDDLTVEYAANVKN